MKVLGIIAEYNPFHKGHLYHLQKSKEITGADVTVAVMSGNFVQRGEPAMVDKWTRAEIAVLNGVDVVFELPFAFACNSAEYFARGGISILEGLGCVDYISFGCEEGQLQKLASFAGIFAEETDEYKAMLKSMLDTGLSYPKARARAAVKLTGMDEETMAAPNNILAIEYLKQLRLQNSKIEPIPVKRIGCGYNDSSLTGEFAGATAIRQNTGRNLSSETVKKHLTERTIDILERESAAGMTKTVQDDFSKLLLTLIYRTQSKDIANIFACGEGLENRIKSCCRKVKTTTGLIKETRSKRYTETRVKRLMMQMLVGLNKSDMEQILTVRTNYARILAFSPKGAQLLKQIKNNECAQIPVITNVNKYTERDENLRKLLNYDIIASDIYNTISGRDVYKQSDFTVSPYIGT